jgi:hypothetical protein
MLGLLLRFVDGGFEPRVVEVFERLAADLFGHFLLASADEDLCVPWG